MPLISRYFLFPTVLLQKLLPILFSLNLVLEKLESVLSSVTALTNRLNPLPCFMDF
jgi:hypothetical protein